MTCANTSPPLGLTFGNVSLSSGIVSRGIGISIGSPLQLLSLKPSTSDDITWVYNAVDCKDDKDWSCINNYGGVYNTSKSRTYQPKSANTWNGTGLTLDSTKPSSSYIYFEDDIFYGKNGTSWGFPMITRTASYNTGGGLGLGVNSTFLDQAVRTGSAPTKSWGMWVGSRSITAPVDGALWIGGYDTTRVAKAFTNFSAAYDKCVTCVTVTDVRYQYNSTSISLFGNSTTQTMNVALQPYTRFLEVPDFMFRALIAATQQQGTYRANSGTLTFNRDALMGSLNVTIQDKDQNPYTTLIPASELFFPPRGPDSTTGVYSISDNSYLITALLNTTYTPGYVYDWGIPFLTMNYMIMDYENKVFRMAPARQGPTGNTGSLIQPLCAGVPSAVITPVIGSTGSATSTPDPSGGSSGGANVGAIAGGVVGGVAVLIIVAVLAWFLLRSKKKQKALKAERDAAVAQGSEAGMPHERMSQYTATHPPTEVSQVYAGGKAYGQHNPQNPHIDKWLSAQNEPSELGSPVPAYAPPSVSGTHGGSTYAPPSVTHTSANMNEPFEMPAYQYK